MGRHELDRDRGRDFFSSFSSISSSESWELRLES